MNIFSRLQLHPGQNGQTAAFCGLLNRSNIGCGIMIRDRNQADVAFYCLQDDQRRQHFQFGARRQDCVDVELRPKCLHTNSQESRFRVRYSARMPSSHNLPAVV